MADNLVVKTDMIDSWAAKFGDVAEACNDALSILNGVSTSGSWWNRFHFNAATVQLRDMNKKLSMNGMGAEAVRTLRNTLSEYNSWTRKLSGQVSKAGRLFTEAEVAITNTMGASSAGNGMQQVINAVGAAAGAGASIAAGASDTGAKTSGKVKVPEWMKLISKITSKFGPGGAAISTVADAIFKGVEGKFDGYELAKTGAKTGKVIVDWAKEVKDGKSIFEVSQKSFAEGMSNPVTWIVTGITSGIDNFKQWKNGEISADRAVVEWGWETGTNVVVGALATSAATAAVSGAFALAGVTAPVWVTGALVAVGAGTIAWGADWICKQFTGKGLGETVGDIAGTVYDKGKEVAGKVVDTAAKAVSDAYDAAKKTAAKATNAVCDGAKATWKFVTSIF